MRTRAEDGARRCPFFPQQGGETRKPGLNNGRAPRVSELGGTFCLWGCSSETCWVGAPRVLAPAWCPVCVPSVALREQDVSQALLARHPRALLPLHASHEPQRVCPGCP